MQIRAAQRLAATDVEAQFDGNKEGELREIQAKLRQHGLVFSFAAHVLYHKSNEHEIAVEAARTAEVLNGMGFALRIIPGIFTKPSYALKGRDGLCLQKVQTALRIFFSI